MFISFLWGVFVRGVFGKGDFCLGVLVWGFFVLIPILTRGDAIDSHVSKVSNNCAEKSLNFEINQLHVKLNIILL